MEWGWDYLIGHEGDVLWHSFILSVPLEYFFFFKRRPYQNYKASPERSPAAKGKWPPLCTTRALPRTGGHVASAERLINSPHFINLQMPPLIKRAVIVSCSIMHAPVFLEELDWRSSTWQRKSDYEIIITFLSVNHAKQGMVERILSTTLKKTYVSVFFRFPPLCPLIEVILFK